MGLGVGNYEWGVLSWILLNHIMLSIYKTVTHITNLKIFAARFLMSV